MSLLCRGWRRHHFHHTSTIATQPNRYCNRGAIFGKRAPVYTSARRHISHPSSNTGIVITIVSRIHKQFTDGSSFSDVYHDIRAIMEYLEPLCFNSYGTTLQLTPRYQVQEQPSHLWQCPLHDQFRDLLGRDIGLFNDFWYIFRVVQSNPITQLLLRAWIWPLIKYTEESVIPGASWKKPKVRKTHLRSGS